MMIDISAFIDGLCAFFAEGTALGALVTFLVANLPSFLVTISTVKRWLAGTKHSISVVQSDCKQLATLYTEDIAKLQNAVESQRLAANQTLAVLALAFGNSKLDPAVRAEIEKLVTGATTLQDKAELETLLATTASATTPAQEALPDGLAEFANDTVILQD